MYEDEAIMEGRENAAEDDSRAPKPSVPENDSERRLYIKGSVIFGPGLEPEPVGRFIMTETDVLDEEYGEEDDEDEEDDDFILKIPDTPEDDDIDWSKSFQ